MVLKGLGSALSNNAVYPDLVVALHAETEAHLADQPGLQAADWPRMAGAWGCPGPESATAGACWRQIWPK